MQPTVPTGPDVKWRFFWRVGPRPACTAFPELNAEPVVPADMPGWAQQLDRWGSKLLAAVQAVAQLAALGLGLEGGELVEAMRDGPHLLAPTGVDVGHHRTVRCDTPQLAQAHGGVCVSGPVTSCAAGRVA